MNATFPRAAKDTWNVRESTVFGDPLINAVAHWLPLAQSWLRARKRRPPRAWATALWRRDALHFRVLFHGAAGSNRARELNERTWELGDVCELFLQRADATEYLEIHVTPENVRLQLRWPEGGLARLRRGDSALAEFAITDPNWVQSSVEKYPTAWQVDLAVQASCLGVDHFDESVTVRAAVCAYRYSNSGAPADLVSTAQLEIPGFHQPSRWHRLALQSDRAPPCENKALAPSLRPDYSAERLAAWFARHEESIQDARSGDVRVAFIGDSLTAGWQERGKEYWDRCFRPLGAVNFGVPGDRTQQVLWRMARPEFSTFDPTAAVLLIGTNNLDPGFSGTDSPSLTPRNSPAEIRAGVASIVGGMLRRWPKTRILLLGILPRGERGSGERSTIADLNAKLADIADDRVRFIDLTHRFIDASGALTSAFMPDGLHLSKNGYRILANAIADPVQQLLVTGAALTDKRKP